MVYILAAGVYFSGFAKDLMCLPRPLSPPLQRITMSGSVALEYGFPSTHSANAVSVAMYSIYLLRNAESAGTPLNMALQGLSYFYFFSIALGRLYCGMHGFFDVIFGTALGAIIAFLQCRYGDAFDQYIFEGDVQRLVIATLIILVLVRIHPEPADNCPCYDDSVSFAGVVMGVLIGCWHYAHSGWALDTPAPATAPFDLAKMGWVVATARILLGVIIVFVWRAVMKPTLLRVLPPIFRTIEHYGLTLPRRYFTPASQYKTVPAEQPYDDNVIPSARDIPGLLRRRRAISVGPQSEADAYEAMAYRNKQRRDSLQLGTVEASPPSSPRGGYFAEAAGDEGAPGKSNRKRASSLEQFKAQMGMGAEALSPNAVASPAASQMNSPVEDARREALQAKILFASVQKPRVRYDVEVVTKLIVYCGIAALAVEINPLIFEQVGLGLK
jgi:dihydrosphingosine 1-phosphate phosphatase